MGLMPPSVLSAQKGFVKGKVVDNQSNAPLSYASIRIMKSTDSTLVGGNITDENGNFLIETSFGQAFASVEFIGYKTMNLPFFTLSKEKTIQDFGTIKLSAATKQLDEVVVQAEKSTMELALDKKIFNVGKDLANAGGTATDILNNIPSVSVDVEGNVKLRGSENVRILIDGKPSGLVSFKGSAGLQQLQGSLIEKVEVITNPSARYEAEGMSGIINIILKKEQKQGLNGSFEVTTGYPMNYGLAANVNYRHKKVNFFINYGIAYRRLPSVGAIYQEVYTSDTTFITQMNRETNMTGFHNNIKAGADYFFNPKNTLTAYYMLRRTDVRRITDLVYKDYLFKTDKLNTITNRQQDEKETEPNSEYALTYKRTYDKKGQELVADLRFLDYWERSDQVFTQTSTFANGSPNPANTKLQKSLNDEFEKQFLIQLDYVKPLSKEGKFETGMRTSFRHMINDFLATEQGRNGEFFTLPGLDNYFIYDENIYAAYAILGNKKEKFSYQFGLRGEITDVKTTLRKTNEVNPRQYANLFPSAHFTYKLPKENAIQLSYSRRVRRPRYDELSPFVTYSDNRNFFSGNPDLNPEFSHAFDLGHIKYFDKGSLAASIYYRHTSDKVLNIRRVDSLGFANTKPENLLTEDAFGAEFTSQLTLVKGWKTDWSVNFFRAITDGANIESALESDTYSWFARHTSRFSLPQNIDLQVRASYEAPQKTPQGERKSLYYVDLGANKDVLKGKGTITFNVSDVFNSRRMRTITEGVNFYSYSDFQGRRRQMNLTFAYRLNQTKQMAKKSINEE
ncbi:MAG: TonB-dependent receptor [Saprospiraceae bacterium]|nr:TonB-dependent receptor [Saprospiraceae bacterium]